MAASRGAGVQSAKRSRSTPRRSFLLPSWEPKGDGSMSDQPVRPKNDVPPHDPAATEPGAPPDPSRRELLRLGVLAGAGVSVAGLLKPAAAAAAGPVTAPAQELEEATIAELQAAMVRGGLTSQILVNQYLER